MSRLSIFRFNLILDHFMKLFYQLHGLLVFLLNLLVLPELLLLFKLVIVSSFSYSLMPNNNLFNLKVFSRLQLLKYFLLNFLISCLKFISHSHLFDFIFNLMRIIVALVFFYKLNAQLLVI